MGFVLHMISFSCFSGVPVAHLFSFLCCVYDGFPVAHLFSFQCCVYGGVPVAHLFSFLCCVYGGTSEVDISFFNNDSTH